MLRGLYLNQTLDPSATTLEEEDQSFPGDINPFIEKRLRLLDNEAFLRFTSLQTILNSTNPRYSKENIAMMPIYQLKTIYKLYPEEIVNIVLRSILKTGNKYIYKLDIPKDTPVRTLLDENPYPERDGDYLVKILNEEYNAEVL